MTEKPRVYKQERTVHEKVVNITHHQGTANQNYNEIITSCLLECLPLKRQEISIDHYVEKREP